MKRKLSPDTIAVGALLALTVLFFWQHLFTDRVFARGDAFTYFYPYWGYRNAALAAGRLPLWATELFMGVPILANSQVGVLYPPNWLFIGVDAPTAFGWSAALHTFWAACGMYIWARRGMRLAPFPALAAALTFAFSGAVLGKVEQINQLQGIAWMPWLFWLQGESRRQPRLLPVFGAAFALQLLAGHTQSAFITGVGLGMLALWAIFQRWRSENAITGWEVVQVGLAAVIAAGLAAPQLLPTFELSGLSNRAGGLTPLEAVSFSFQPQLIGRGLLPNYVGDPLFSEYLVSLSVVGLVLAVWAAWSLRHDDRAQGLMVFGGSGLFLALGAYNPIYWLLVRIVPGFDLFRAPARWMILPTMAAALLVGLALAHVSKHNPRGLMAAAGTALLLMAAAFAAPLSDAPGATRPGLLTVSLWAVALIAAVGILHLRPRLGPVLLGVIGAELFAASLGMSFNRLSDADAWTIQRPAMSTIIAQNGASPVPDRFISLSDIVFDPGDLRELEAIYGPTLSEDTLFDFVVATKQKEIIAPNLPLAWGIPAIDGYGGGLLPLRSYVDYTRQFTDEVGVDGRLRENLTQVPDFTWLEATNTRYIITDKVFDAWVDGIYHDLQFPDDSAVVTATPPVAFEATAASIVVEGGAAGQELGTVLIYPQGEGEVIRQGLLWDGTFTTVEGDPVIRVSWGPPVTVDRITIEGATVRGVTLVDERSGAFVATQLPDDLRLIHSGDVKVYAYDGAGERASLLGQNGEPCASGTLRILSYRPEHIRFRVEDAAADCVLLLRDTYYPAWEATIDGESAAIEAAEGLFRRVDVPAGTSHVMMTYSPHLYRRGLMVAAATAVAATGFGLAYPSRSEPSPAE